MSNWREPSADDAAAFMATVVLTRAEGTDDSKLENILTIVTQRVRGTIGAAGITPLSANANEVPPEGLQHTLILAIFALVSATPGFQFITKDEFDKQVERAEKWLEAVANHRPVTYPDTVSAATAALGGLVRWGSEDLYDMSTT